MELLADRALRPLRADEALELDALLAREPAGIAEAEDLELAAAAADLALFGMGADPLPDSLRATLEAQAPAALATAPRPTGAAVAGRIAPGAAAGWLVAAACLAVAATLSFMQPAGVAPAPADPSALRQTLLASAADATRWAWTALGELEKAPVAGDAVWSTSRQQGVMTFDGLPANDPAKEQYQLWIFDPAQSDKTPIDGGVFDVPPGGRAVVPMDPKIRVSDAAMFAVTIEKPGGVVVSDRSRLVLIAKPG
jgi:hypothetical protein